MDESSAEQKIADQSTIDSAANSDVISEDTVKKTWNDTTHLHGNLRRSEYKNFHGKLPLLMNDICKCPDCPTTGTQSVAVNSEFHFDHVTRESSMDTGSFMHNNSYHFRTKDCEECTEKDKHHIPKISYTEVQAKYTGPSRTTANAVRLKKIFNRQFHPAFTQHLQSKLTGTSSIAQAYPAEAADNSATDA